MQPKQLNEPFNYLDKQKLEHTELIMYISSVWSLL